jgi:hypothetical protein
VSVRALVANIANWFALGGATISGALLALLALALFLSG